MSAKTAVVIPGRLGDICNCLSVIRDVALKEGGKCAVVVSDEFASILDGCSYVEPVVISSQFTDIVPAIEQARAMFPKVLVAKVSEKAVGISTQCESFSQEQWRQCGYWEKGDSESANSRWNTLPLVFDRRDRYREGKLLELCNHRTCARRVLVNCTGKSAPYPQEKELLKVLHGLNSATGVHVLDLKHVKAFRVFDLLALFDHSDLLVTSDTATLHLAAASGIPTVNLVGDKPTLWHGSKPRNNSVLEIRYSETEKLKEIAHLSLEFPILSWRPRTWHVWSDYPMTGDTLRRHQLARSTWPMSWIDFPVKENRRVINDPMRSVPFIKDLIAQVVDCAGPRDRIVLTNADTCVSDEAAVRMEEALRERGSAYSFRRDFMGLNGTKRADEIRQGRQYEGADLFAFSIEWWTKHGRLLPDLVLGAEAWDWCLRTLMHTTGGAQFNDLIYHEIHANTWEHPEHRNNLPSQLHNKRIAAPFLAEHGVAFS